MPPNKALQLTWHSAFQSGSDSILASTLGASPTIGGLRHAAERPIRYTAHEIRAQSAMVRISYSAPDEIELAGTKGDFAALWAELQAFLSAAAEVARIPADPDFDPAPYETRLHSIEFLRRSGPNTVSVDGNVLRISGSDDNLALFGSWLDFERAVAPQHSHYEYYEGNRWVAPDSLPLVISLERERAV